MDFEAGMIRAVKESFDACRIVGCDFHFKMCIRDKLQSLGLASMYKEYQEVQTFVRYLWALSVVPLDHVIPVWERFILKNVPTVEDEDLTGDDDIEAAQNLNDQLQQVVVYFENTWLGGKNQRNPNLPRRKPRIPLEIWNKHQSVMMNEELTNNSSENWNSVSKIGLNMNPNIWVILNMFKREESLARTKINSTALGTAAIDHPARRKKVQEKREKLRRVLEQFDKVSVEDFMNMVVAHYND